VLPSDLRKHIQTVLRLVPGEHFELFDGTGAVAKVELQADAQVAILEVVRHPLPACHLSLLQGLPKGERLDFILQKGTELGVNRFELISMERSIGQLKKERKDKKSERWEKIIQEAARQCHQYHLPQLQVSADFSASVAGVTADLKLILWEGSEQPLAAVLPKQVPARVALVVGPEGGISASEVKLAEECGFVPVSLGPRILRTETAGLAMVAVLQYLYGDLAAGRQV